MDTKRIPEKAFSDKADMAWEMYLDIKPHLVMIGDDNGLRLLGPKFAKTKTPVVFFGINNNPRNYFEKLPDNITGILERTPTIQLLRSLSHIIPKAKKALILIDSSPTSNAIIDTSFENRKFMQIGRLLAEVKTATSWQEWKSKVINSNGYDFIVTPTFHTLKDEKGKSISVENIVGWTSESSSLPVFSNQDYTVSSKGFVGAYVVHGETHGKLAAEIALAILENRSFNIKTDKDGKFYFNREQLNRFNIILPDHFEKRATFQ